MALPGAVVAAGDPLGDDSQKLTEESGKKKSAVFRLSLGTVEESNSREDPTPTAGIKKKTSEGGKALGPAKKSFFAAKEDPVIPAGLPVDATAYFGW